MSLENDIEYYKKGNMSNETLILKYGNRCSGKEYIRSIKMEVIEIEELKKMLREKIKDQIEFMDDSGIDTSEKIMNLSIAYYNLNNSRDWHEIIQHEDS